MVLCRKMFEEALCSMNSFLKNSFAVSNWCNTFSFRHIRNKGKYKAAITQEHKANEKVAPYCAMILFTAEDLMLGSKLHNRPLFLVYSIQ